MTSTSEAAGLEGVSQSSFSVSHVGQRWEVRLPVWKELQVWLPVCGNLWAASLGLVALAERWQGRKQQAVPGQRQLWAQLQSEQTAACPAQLQLEQDRL